MMDGKAEAGSKRGCGEVELTSSGSLFNTLSGFEAADNRNCWENFKLLLSDLEFRSDASKGWMATDETSDNVTLMVSVEDTGIGIPLQAQNRVFTPFMQADSSTSRNYGGTGIGLSISKCLVEMMGGEIYFKSRPHIGSTFTFTAVLKRCNKNALGDLKRPLSDALPTTFKGMKAIVIDGKPVRGAVTQYHLERLGITVDFASTSNINIALGAVSKQNGCSRNG